MLVTDMLVTELILHKLRSEIRQYQGIIPLSSMWSLSCLDLANILGKKYSNEETYKSHPFPIPSTKMRIVRSSAIEGHLRTFNQDLTTCK